MSMYSEHELLSLFCNVLCDTNGGTTFYRYLCCLRVLEPLSILKGGIIFIFVSSIELLTFFIDVHFVVTN